MATKDISAANAPEPCDLMVSNGYVLSMDANRTVYPRGAIAIKGSRIAAVGPAREVGARFRPRRTIDAAGGAVHPGFIDGHYHATLHLSRGAITDNPHPPADPGEELGPGAYIVWINALDDEDEYASALMACVEMVRNGFTGFMEPGTAFEPDAVAQAAEDVGIRASVADPFLWDRPDAEGMSTQIRRAPADAKRAMRTLGQQLKRNRDPDALVRAHVALYGIGSGSEELIRAGKACADENKVALAQHQNFMAEDVDFDTARFGRHPLLHLADKGLLGPNCTFTHMNVIHDDEVKAVVESGLSIVWHPGNYMFYAISRQMKTRMPDLFKAGTNMTFGCDVAKVWAFGELGWLAYLVARDIGAYLPSEGILEMFTIGGARAMGLHGETGSLEPGKRADLVIRSNDLPDQQPNLDVVRQFMLVSRTKSVDTVIVNGEIVVRNGRLTRLDEATAYARAQASGRRMAERTGMAPGTFWPVVE
jgi:cytosine/adenosine deaminase-related metal-dependent hydrolase